MNLYSLKVIKLNAFWPLLALSSSIAASIKIRRDSGHHGSGHNIMTIGTTVAPISQKVIILPGVFLVLVSILLLKLLLYQSHLQIKNYSWNILPELS